MPGHACRTCQTAPSASEPPSSAAPRCDSMQTCCCTMSARAAINRCTCGHAACSTGLPTCVCLSTCRAQPVGVRCPLAPTCSNHVLRPSPSLVAGAGRGLTCPTQTHWLGFWTHGSGLCLCYSADGVKNQYVCCCPQLMSALAITVSHVTYQQFLGNVSPAALAQGRLPTPPPPHPHPNSACECLATNTHMHGNLATSTHMHVGPRSCRGWRCRGFRRTAGTCAPATTATAWAPSAGSFTARLSMSPSTPTSSSSTPQCGGRSCPPMSRCALAWHLCRRPRTRTQPHHLRPSAV